MTDLFSVSPAHRAYDNIDNNGNNHNAGQNMSYAISSPAATTAGQGNTPVSSISDPFPFLCRGRTLASFRCCQIRSWHSCPGESKVFLIARPSNLSSSYQHQMSTPKPLLTLSKTCPPAVHCECNFQIHHVDIPD
jgi:hypothetical protein